MASSKPSSLFPSRCSFTSRNNADMPHSLRLYRVLIESSHIADCIQELKVYEGQSFREQDWIGKDHILPFLLVRLTNLKRIELRRLEWNELPVGLRWSIRSVLGLPSLTFIEIETSNFANMDDFTSLLSHAENLTSLSLKNIRTSWHFAEPLTHEETNQVIGEKVRPLDSYGRKNLLELDLTLHDLLHFCDWLLGPQSPWGMSHIHTLKILHTNHTDEPAVNRLLHAIGNGLKHFEFKMPWIPISTIESSAVDINVEFNSNLKYLHLKRVVEQNDCIEESLLRLIRFFSSFAESNQLEEIEFAMNNILYDDGPVDLSLWQEVDQILAGSRFKCLQKVDIDTYHVVDGRSPELIRDLARWSPLMGERGAIHDTSFSSESDIVY